MGNVSADQSGRLLNKISLTTEDRFVKRYQFAKFQKKTMIIAKVMIYKNCWALGIGPHHDEQQFFRFVFENDVSNKSGPLIHLKKTKAFILPLSFIIPKLYFFFSKTGEYYYKKDLWTI